MQSVKIKTLTSTTATQQTVFDAALGVVQNGKFTIVGLSNENHRLAFRSGLSPLSWGREFLLTAQPDPAGGVLLEVACGGVDGVPQALLDGWKNGKAADKLLQSIQAVLDGTETAPVTPTASFTAAADGSHQPPADEA